MVFQTFIKIINVPLFRIEFFCGDMSNEENDKKPLETESKVNDEAQEKETVTLNTVTVENGEQVQNGGR